MRKNEKSRAAYERALGLMPGGVNSPVRAFAAVGGGPLFVQSARGARVVDIDGNDYVDYVGSWGPLILGHADADVVAAIAAAAARGTSFGAPTEAESELAEAIRECVPSMEKMRLVNSGTEATMSAIRLARGFTGRETVVKFEGCYHGHVDALLVRAGSGLATFGAPSSAGVPEAVAGATLALPYNDTEKFVGAMKKYGERVACVIVEPVAANMGLVPPTAGFLEALREACTRHGALLIFDEVITGFRLGLGGAQKLFGVTPDITTLGKIIGGGLPMGAYGGRADAMAAISPEGQVYQAGTLSGNPVAVAAGIATLKKLRREGFYEALESRAAALAAGLTAAARAAGAATYHARVGSMLCAFFREGEVRDFADAQRCDTAAYARFFNAMLERGFYFAPSQFETAFVGAAHTDADIARTVEAAREAFALSRA